MTKNTIKGMPKAGMNKPMPPKGDHIMNQHMMSEKEMAGMMNMGKPMKHK